MMIRASCGADGDRGQIGMFAGQPIWFGRAWVQRDGGERPRPTSAEKARIKKFKRENRELRLANEILCKGEPVPPLCQPALFIESGRDWLRAPESAVDSSF